jgi:hypothetical protein
MSEAAILMAIPSACIEGRRHRLGMVSAGWRWFRVAIMQPAALAQEKHVTRAPVSAALAARLRAGAGPIACGPAGR